SPKRSGEYAAKTATFLLLETTVRPPNGVPCCRLSGTFVPRSLTGTMWCVIVASVTRPTSRQGTSAWSPWTWPVGPSHIPPELSVRCHTSHVLAGAHTASLLGGLRPCSLRIPAPHPQVQTCPHFGQR